MRRGCETRDECDVTGIRQGGHDTGDVMSIGAFRGENAPSTNTAIIMRFDKGSMQSAPVWRGNTSRIDPSSYYPLYRGKHVARRGHLMDSQRRRHVAWDLRPLAVRRKRCGPE